MRTHQDVFTPMRGHIEDGCVIDCENGDVLALKADMSGWSASPSWPSATSPACRKARCSRSKTCAVTATPAACLSRTPTRSGAHFLACS